MSKKFLLPEQGQFYKANLHCHSTLSDGRLTLEQLKQAYRGQGYAIVAYTDHNRYAWHPELCDEGFLALAAYEIDINAPMERAIITTAAPTTSILIPTRRPNPRKNGEHPRRTAPTRIYQRLH
ncbi:MAG: PHP domain-containing protein [Hydrogeniiclostridium mannosilyticum]